MCPLCSNPAINFFTQTEKVNWQLYGKDPHQEKELKFFQCQTCELVFKDAKVHLSPILEKERYLQHNNLFGDEKYEKFLSQVVDSLVPKLAPNAEGLDYGCGSAAVMGELFQRKGYACDSYDPLFKNETRLLEKQYDFVSACEVVEHFYSPAEGFQKLFSILKNGAWLAVRTECPPAQFKTWWYHNDPTHVSFYSRKTFEWIANEFNAQLEFHSPEIVLFKKRF